MLCSLSQEEEWLWGGDVLMSQVGLMWSWFDVRQVSGMDPSQIRICARHPKPCLSFLLLKSAIAISSMRLYFMKLSCLTEMR